MADATVYKVGAFLPVSPEFLADVAVARAVLDDAYEELYLAMAGTPRYGPPAPRPEPELCPECGRDLEGDW